MSAAAARLSDQVVARVPTPHSGASDNILERVTLSDGRRLICKRVSQEWDWLSRATNDRGRALAMWKGGLFDRIPATIDHATVAVEADGDAWNVFMRDVSASLVPDDARLDRDAVHRLLRALSQFHLAFWGEGFPELCPLEDRYRLSSPQTAATEQDRIAAKAPIIERCWEVFADLAPDDVATAVLTLVERPGLLADQLRRCEQTLVHGDVRLSNLGFADGRVVLIDWGERTGPAPAAVELASFLVFDARRLDVSREEVIADFRALYRDRFDETALQLALIGGVVQLGGILVMGMVLTDGQAERAAAVSEVAWWSGTVRNALETWSPT